MVAPAKIRESVNLAMAPDESNKPPALPESVVQTQIDPSILEFGKENVILTDHDGGRYRIPSSLCSTWVVGFSPLEPCN